MKRHAGSEKQGSVIVMVTLALLLLLAMIGMVVDLGLAYYYRRAAQAAADAAAQAGAKKAHELGLAKGSFVGLDSALIEAEAIAYADRNGFTNNGDGGKQTVTILTGEGKYPTGELNNLNIYYWVEARVQTRVSSLFILAAGAGESLESGANAVAAVLQAPLEGSVYILNRTCDATGTNCGAPDGAPMGPGGKVMKGVNVARSGSGSITVDGGVFMNSSANGDSRTSGNYALENSGGGSSPAINSSFVRFAWDGPYKGKPSSDSAISSAYSHGPQVEDPTYSFNLGRQPQVWTANQVLGQYGGNVIGVTAALDGATLGPGVYIAGTPDPANGQFRISGQPISLRNVTFSNGGDPSASFIFLGGVSFGNQNSDMINLAPGVYVAAGIPENRSYPVLDLTKSNVNGVGGSGMMFLTTKPNYRPDSASPPLLDLSGGTALPVLAIGGNGQPIAPNPLPADFGPVATWKFGHTELKSGAGNANIGFTGLQGRSPCDPGACATINDQLFHYQPTLIWQDRRNCFGVTPDPGTPGLPCEGDANSVKTVADANAFGGVNGLLYQPRGAFLELTGGSAGGSATINNAAKLVTGAISLRGSRQITLQPLPVSATQTIVSLVR